MKCGFLPDPKRRWTSLLILLLAWVRLAACAVEPPRGEGEPFMQPFSPRDYHAGTQCWCVAQDHRRVMYVGNQGCVLEYDGSSWRRIPVGEGTLVTGLAYEAGTDTVFVGAQNNLGCLKPVPGGERIFVSLLDQLPADARDVGAVYGVYATPGGVFFVGINRVMRWREGRFRTWTLATTSRLRSSWAAGGLYVFNPEIGLLRLEDDRFVPASDEAIFHRASVRAIVAGSDGVLLVGTLHDGLLALHGGTVSPLDGECAGLLKDKGIYNMVRLRDGSLAIATDSAGLLVLDRERRFRNRVDDTGGLHGNNILNLYEDAEGGLWLGLQSGVTRAEINSPFSILRAGRDDDLSDTYHVAYWFDKLVVGNHTGLYRVAAADPSTLTGAHLERWPGITEAFRSTCTVANGLLTVAGGKIALLDATSRLIPVAPDIADAGFLWPSRLQADVVFVGSESGRVYKLSLDGGTRRWVNGGVVADAGKTGEFGLAESAQGTLWLGTREHGLFRAQLASADHPAQVVSFFDRPGPLQGVPFVLASSDGGPIIFQALQKLCRLDESGQSVRLATDFGERFGDGSLRFETVLSYDAQSLWITARHANDVAGEQICGRAVAGGNGRAPVFRALPHQVQEALGEARGYLPVDVPPDPLTTLLIAGATGNGLVRLDVRQWDAQGSPPPFDTLIRRAVVTSQGFPGRGPEPILQGPLPYAHHSVHFEFAAGTLAFGAVPRFQTRLVNFGAGEWSDFSDRASVDYLNLPEGGYTFEVRARNADGQLGGVASLPFRILPPWQRSPWAYALYALAAALGLCALVRWRGGQLEKRNAVLAALVSARTGELRAREADLLANERNLVRARDDAEQANRAKSAFLANMSHELRTPLNAILGYSQIILKHADLPARTREQVTVIGQSGGHLLSLINEVLDLSKIEAGKLTLSRHHFSLPQLLDEVSTAFRPRFVEKGLAFAETRVRLPDTVHTDPSRLRQVLYNLLSNAAKFTREGSVSLEIRSTDAGHVRFEVTDTGVGIEKGELRNIFLAFYQAGESSLSAQGTGLGLAISQRLVELLGGRLEVDSTPGRGSRFWFDLPLPPVDVPGGLISPDFSEQTLGVVTGYEGSPRRLLIVDDVPENRRVLHDFLQPLGFEIEEAADGAGCLAACARELPAAILLDLRLGGPDGFQVARTIRARSGGAPLGIIAISASVFESDRQRAIDAGCDDFLPKPFEGTQLLGVLGRVLGLRWISSPPVVAVPPTDDGPADGPTTVPPEETAALLELSLRGDIVGLRKRLDALRAAGATDGTAALVRRLEPLVATYQMDAIHALLLTFQTDAPR